MSVRVMGNVWSSSQAKGSALLVLLAIADHCHDDGDGAYPSINTLAKKTRLTRRNVQLLLRKLEVLGELEVNRSAGPRGVNVFRVVMSDGVQTLHPEILQGDEKQSTLGVKGVSPKPLKETLNTTTNNITADEWEKLIEKFKDVWSEQDIREQVEEALSHDARKKVKSDYLYVRNWLRKNQNSTVRWTNGTKPSKFIQTNSQAETTGVYSGYVSPR